MNIAKSETNRCKYLHTPAKQKDVTGLIEYIWGLKAGLTVCLGHPMYLV